MLFSVICPTAFCFAVEKNLKTQSSVVSELLLCYVWQAAGDVRVTVLCLMGRQDLPQLTVRDLCIKSKGKERARKGDLGSPSYALVWQQENVSNQVPGGP